MKNQKGDGQVVWIVVITVFLLLFFLVYSGVLGKLYNKLFSTTRAQADSVDDYDKDAVANFADKCPCIFGEIENDGCPAGHKITGTGSGKEERSCLT